MSGHWNMQGPRGHHSGISPPSFLAQPEVASGSVLEDGFFDPGKEWFVRWHDLPHWRQDGALCFVTFLLGDSIPQVRLRQWRAEQFEWKRTYPNASDTELNEFASRCRRRVETWLDRSLGSCILRLEPAKIIVESVLRHFDGERYELGEFVVAPNHVHVIVKTAQDIELSEVLYSWKKFSARELLKLDEVRQLMPDRPRHLWQVESFDHIVRNRLSLEKYNRYIRNHDR